MIVLAMLLAAADPCAPLPAASPPDPAVARVYAEVGESERAAGADQSARVAWLEALRYDPANETARRGLDALCPDARFEEGRRLLDDGDPRGAAEILKLARPSRPAALLEGIARYELGDDGAARTLLEEAAQDPTLATAARFYLGLVAMREGDSRGAARELAQVSQDAPFAAAAAELTRAAQRNGKLVLSAMADTGYDSNVTLLPTGVAGGADGTASISGAAVARPMGESGPWLRASGLYRTQFRLHDYDTGALGGAAGWQFGRAARHVGLEYDYDYITLGGQPYLSAHRLRIDTADGIGALLWTAAYSVRFESYLSDATSPFSGTLHSADALIGTRVGGGSILAGYHVGRDFAQQDDTSFFEHGPRAVLDLPLGPRSRLSAEAAATWRAYDGFDPDLGLQRSDVMLDAAAVGEYDLPHGLALRLTTTFRRTFSNDPQLAYNRFTIALGLLVAQGFF
jgi:hypothetical protein